MFGLPITIADEFRIGLAQFRNGAYDGFALFEGGDFESYDRAGVYILRTGRYPRGDDFDQRAIDENTEFTYYSNELSLSPMPPCQARTSFVSVPRTKTSGITKMPNSIPFPFCS